jgi:Holliday junction resolvasome RuvABC endonuclease subunit
MTFSSNKRVASLFDAIYAEEKKFISFFKKVLKNKEDIYATLLAIHHCRNHNTFPDDLFSFVEEECTKVGFEESFLSASEASKTLKVVLGFDPSLTSSGWAVLAVSKDESYLLDSGIFRSKSEESFPERYYYFHKMFETCASLYKPSFIGVEKPQHDASWSAGLYPLWASVSHFSIKDRTPFVAFMPSQIKLLGRILLGRDGGDMSKGDMVDAAHKIIQYRVKDVNHNVADAIVAAYGTLRLSLVLEGVLDESSMNKKESDFFLKTIKRRKTGKVEGTGLIYKEGDAYLNLNDPKYDVLYEFFEKY